MSKYFKTAGFGTALLGKAEAIGTKLLTKTQPLITGAEEFATKFTLPGTGKISKVWNASKTKTGLSNAWGAFGETAAVGKAPLTDFNNLMKSRYMQGDLMKQVGAMTGNKAQIAKGSIKNLNTLGTQILTGFGL